MPWPCCTQPSWSRGRWAHLCAPAHSQVHVLVYLWALVRLCVGECALVCICVRVCVCTVYKCACAGVSMHVQVHVCACGLMTTETQKRGRQASCVARPDKFWVWRGHMQWPLAYSGALAYSRALPFLLWTLSTGASRQWGQPSVHASHQWGEASVHASRQWGQASVGPTVSACKPCSACFIVSATRHRGQRTVLQRRTNSLVLNSKACAVEERRPAL